MAFTVNLSANAGYYTVDSSATSGEAKYTNDSSKEARIGEALAVNGGYSYTATGVIGQSITASDDMNSWQITGTSVADTIVAGKGGATIDGGAGNDSIDLTASANADYVVLGSGSGTDSIVGFGSGDVISLSGASASEVSASYDGTNVVVTVGSDTVILESTNPGSFYVSDGTTTEAINYSTTAGTAGTITASKGTNYYTGSNAAVTFANYGEDVVVDLGNTGSYDGSATYSGIVAATGANNHSNTLVGAATTRNTLVGGANAQNSLYGGGSANDVLVAGNNSENVFFYGESEGNDTIRNYASGTNTIALLSGNSTDASFINGNTQITWSDGSKLTLQGYGGTNRAIYYSTDNGVTSKGLLVGNTNAKNTFTYASDIGIYWGGTKGDALQVNTAEDVNIWLDNTKGVAYSGIKTVNAANATGQAVIVGASTNESIVGGKGDNSLWGGVTNASDTMKGGTGYNEFFFGKDEGNDVITDSKNTDKVVLYNVVSTDLASAAVSGKDMVISLTDGSSLTIKNYTTKGASTFQMGDGSKYTYDSNNNQWVQA